MEEQADTTQHNTNINTTQCDYAKPVANATSAEPPHTVKNCERQHGHGARARPVRPKESFKRLNIINNKHFCVICNERKAQFLQQKI